MLLIVIPSAAAALARRPGAPGGGGAGGHAGLWALEAAALLAPPMAALVLRCVDRRLWLENRERIW